MIETLKSPKFQLRFSIILLILSMVLRIPAYLLNWLESVPFVSELSIIALNLTALSGVIAALVYMDQTTGFTLNKKDKEWLEELIDRKLRAGDKPVYSAKEQTSTTGD